ncbi:SCO0930 family lipoprotein [Streptomyces sp. NPDC049910]|uniref:SCO0930 family lipoprotein n=1 Tax=Streptomyces sp. NPDC049910 TaxID=3155278 RepID=UPI003435CD50
MKTWRNASLAVTAATVLALTTACGQETGTQPNGQAVGAVNPAGQPAANSGYGSGYGGGGAPAGAADAKPSTAGQLAVWESKKLGEVLTDGEGMTLYRFDKDSVDPVTSNCNGDCAKAWPVVAAGDVTPAPGTDASLIGSVTRADGTKQLTVGGWPMYRYAKDAKPGDANGQGVGGTWFASAPDGKKAALGGGGEEAGGEESAEEAGGESVDLAGLSVRKDPKLGEIVVDKNGMTAYVFTKDSAWPMKTACTGACLEKWPVIAPVDANDTVGILKKGFVTFDRPDGIKQQTIDCWPIYTFAGDKKPGDTNGQGVGGTWFAVSPQGKPVGAPS